MSTELSAMRADATAIDQHAAIWFGALQRAERMQLDACHATLLAWLMGLPAGFDPAAAAAAIITYQQRSADALLSPQLTALLQNVARYPTDRLARLGASRRSRRLAH